MSPSALARLRSFRMLASTLVASFVGQVEAEAQAAAGHRDDVLEAITFSDSQGLVDVAWLDRVPLLAIVRDGPRFLDLHARVSSRASAVRDALVDEGLVPP